MDTLQRKKQLLEHMESRTQWRRADQERVWALRCEVQSLEQNRPLNEDERLRNRVRHHH